MDLFTKAAELGIQTEFIDGQGHRHVTDAAALEIILNALPPHAPHRFFDWPVVVQSGQPSPAEFGEAVTLPVEWKIVADLKVIAKGEAGDRSMIWPGDLPIGSYRLHLTDASLVSEEVPLIVAPPKAFGGDFDRSWLLAVQLYGVRSSRNWGIGDFTDLEGLIELAAGLGAGGVGLNPLHALFDDRPADCSPYSPNSRLFLNPLYIDVEKLPEFSRRDFAEDDAISRSRQSAIVDYVAVAELKWRALRLAFAGFKASPNAKRQAALERFRAERGVLLSRFACFEALRHKFKVPW
jgi:4-alpha-glucanotransferase